MVSLRCLGSDDVLRHLIMLLFGIRSETYRPNALCNGSCYISACTAEPRCEDLHRCHTSSDNSFLTYTFPKIVQSAGYPDSDLHETYSS